MKSTGNYERNHSDSFTGKERDAETGYCYFGARYYDSDLSGLFLSVDPMADKYPNISPYAYCAWNPLKLVDPDGEEIYPTKTSAEIDRKRAISLFGANNVSQVYDNGNNGKHDYVFNVHAPKSVDSKQRVNAIISNNNELLKYEFGGAPRKNVISSTLSFGGQVDFAMFGLNLSNVNLFDISFDTESTTFNLNTIKEGSADCSAGVTIGGVSYSIGYSGGDNINPNSLTHKVSYGPVAVNMTNGDVEFGLDVSLVFGLSLKITSKIIK